MGAYYNEHDPKAAAWLRELIRQGQIAPGDVDERSVEDVAPSDLRNYTQCHFFAGIGVWSYALRQAGWPDDRPVWTGSCPCQSFSAAGQGKGFADERHLWPAWFHLISQCRPAIVFGEQVEAAIRHGWLDIVQSDLEGIGYACGAVPFPACGVGAPHIRQRLYFVADANDARSQGWGVLPERAGERAAGPDGMAGLVALTDDAERRADATTGHVSDRHHAGRAQGAGDVEGCGDAGELADAMPAGRAEGRAVSGDRSVAGSGGAGELAEPAHVGHERAGPAWRRGNGLADGGSIDRPGPTNGFWASADWIGCTDNRWRPVKPGAFPLVDGSAFKLDSGSAFAGKSRVAMLRGAGNAIAAPQAIAFIEAYLQC